MLKMIVAQESFDELKEHIGEEVEMVSVRDGSRLIVNRGFILCVNDFVAISLSSIYEPFVSYQKRGILSIKLVNGGKELFRNDSILKIDNNLSDEEWYESAVSKLYGTEYLDDLKRKCNSGTSKKEKTNVYSKEELEKMDLERLNDSATKALRKYSSDIALPLSIKSKLISTGILFISQDKFEDWRGFVEKLFIAGEFVVAINAIIELLSLLEKGEDTKESIKYIREKFYFLDYDLKELIINSSIYFSPYGATIRQLCYGLSEDTNTMCKR